MGPSHTDLLPLHLGIYIYICLLGERKMWIHFNALGFANPEYLREREGRLTGFFFWRHQKKIVNPSPRSELPVQLQTQLILDLKKKKHEGLEKKKKKRKSPHWCKWGKIPQPSLAPGPPAGFPGLPTLSLDGWVGFNSRGCHVALSAADF